MNPKSYDPILMAELREGYGREWFKHYDRAYREKHAITYKDITQAKEAPVVPIKKVYTVAECDSIDCDLSFERLTK
jgi:hypothetical protein